MLNVNDRHGVTVLEIDHGKVNALDLELLQAIISTFARIEGPVVLTGAGRVFSAGVDLRRIVDDGPEYVIEFLAKLSRSFMAIFDHPAPVVAAINGPAIAGGCVIAAACDLRLLSRGPIGLAELAVGVPFPTSALEIIRSVIGPHAADLVLTARNLDGDEAKSIGLVDEILAAPDLVDAAVNRAARLDALPAGVFAHTKTQLHGAARERIAARGPDDDRRMVELWTSEPVRTAITTFVGGLTDRR